MAKAEIIVQDDDDRVFTRLPNRERYNPSKHRGDESSFRVLYYGGTAGSVPFLWESRPGTPKHSAAGEDDLRPLTPPPSLRPGTPPRPDLRRRKLVSIRTIFPKLPSRKINASPQPPQGSAVPAAPGKSSGVGVGSRTWSLCFGAGIRSPWGVGRPKNTVMSVGRHGRE